jgi:hypothetical protein
MDEELQNFRAWYASVLASLYPNRDAGIAVLMISLALLERYLRQKTLRTPADNVDEACMRELCAIFPVLGTVDVARHFWDIYRNGFLHQVTLSRQKPSGKALPDGSLTHDIAEAIKLEPDGSLCVHPVLFSKQVVDTIERDFAAFAGPGAGAPALPKVERRDPVTIPSSYLGTRGG